MNEPKTPKFHKLKRRLLRKKLKNLMIWALLAIILVFISYISIPYFKFDFKEGYTTIYVEKDIKDNAGVGLGLETFYSVNPKLTKEIKQIKFKNVPEILGEEGIWHLNQVGIYKKEYNSSLIYFYYDYSPGTVYHEIGHNIYYNHLTEKDKKEWKQISKKPYPSEYASTSILEDFPVSFARYMDKDECLYSVEKKVWPCPTEEAFKQKEKCPYGMNATYQCYWERGGLNRARVDYFIKLNERLDFKGEKN